MLITYPPNLVPFILARFSATGPLPLADHRPTTAGPLPAVTPGPQDRRNGLDRQTVTVPAEASDHPGRYRADDRDVAPGFPALGVADVQFDDRPFKGRQGVLQRPRVMGERPGVDHDRSGAPACLVDRLDE